MLASGDGARHLLVLSEAWYSKGEAGLPLVLQITTPSQGVEASELRSEETLKCGDGVGHKQ